MKVVEILINNQVIDLATDTDFPLILANNVYYDNEVSSRGGEYSYTVQFPFTTNNSNIFKLNNIYEEPNKFYRDNLYDSIIYVNSIKVFQGVFSINNFNRDIIEGNFKSNNIAWVSLIGNKSLRDIESFDDYPFQGMITIYNNNLDLYDESDENVFNHNRNYDVCFPLVAYGQYFIPYFTKTKSYIDTSLYNNLIGSTYVNNYEVFNSTSNSIQGLTETVRFVSGELNHLDYADMPPSFYVVNILQKIFKDIGYAVNGTWINDPQVNRLIIPASDIEKIGYNHQTLCYVELTTNELFDLYTSDFWYGIENKQRIDKLITVPPNPPLIPAPNLDFVLNGGAGLASYSMNSLGANDTDVILIDRGFNSANKNIYNTFYVPEDGEYELSYTMNGRISAIVGDTGSLNSTCFPQNLIGFFYVNDEGDFPGIIETVKFINGFTVPFVGNNPDPNEPRLVYEYVPRISAIIGDGYYDTYDVLGMNYNVNDLMDLQNNPQAFNITKTVRVNLKRGEKIRFLVIAQGQDNFTSQGQHRIEIFSGSKYKIRNVSGDIDFKIAKNLPNIKQIDFIKSLITMFNLYFTVDLNGKIISFEKRDNWYLNPSVALDLTKLSDIKESTIERIEIPKFYNWFYKEDSKDYLSNLEPELYNWKEPTYANNQDIEDITVSFSDTRTKTFSLVKNINGNLGSYTQGQMKNPSFREIIDIEIPFIGDEAHHDSIQFDLIVDGNIEEQFKTWKFNHIPRILKIANTQHDFSTSPLIGRFWSFATDTESVNYMTSIGKAVFVESDNTYLNDYQLDSLDWESLYNKNWYNFILNQQRSERIILNAEIDFNVYNMLSANRLIKIEGNYYYLEKFSGYNVINNEMTQLSLIKKTNS